jgi:hypothetical protein
MSWGSGGRLGYRLAHLGPLEPLLRRLTMLASFGAWPRALGRRHMPPGGLVLTGTHFGRHDIGHYLIATGRHIEWVGAVHFLRIPLYGPVAEWGGYFALREPEFGPAEENAAVLDVATDRVRQGAAVGVFVQGFTARFGSAPTRVAAAAAAPVVLVSIYRVQWPPGRPRVLVVVHRPVPPPADDARSRRRFAERLRRRMHALGSHRAEGDAVLIRQAALDDATLWRRPLDVLRRAARLARVRDPEPLARRARFLSRACERLGCSAGDLRHPAGPGHLLAWLALLPLAAAGAALSAPPLLALLLCMRGQPAVDVRSAILRLAPLGAAPWGVVLAVAGLLVAGAWGLALPVVAVAGLCAVGVARRLARTLRGSVAARRHGHRLRAQLQEFDRLVAEAGG